MNAHATVIAAEAEAEDTTTNLVVVEPETALAVLTDPERFDDFLARVKAFTDALVPDTSTAKGRDEIRSAAAKVARSKTAIDKAGLGLTEEWRANTEKVNASRRLIKEKLDALRDEVRKPLTDWETAEEERVERVKLTLARLQAAAVVSIEDTVETVQARLDTIAGVEITAEVFQEYEAAALSHQEHTTATLTAAVARLTREAEERAELERLRQADAERQERDAEARRAEEEAERRREYARKIIDHIKQVGLGMIGGQTYPFAILLRELEQKIEIDDSLGDMKDEVARVRDEALKDLKAAMERQAAEAAAQAKADEAARGERERVQREEATAKAAADAQAETERKAAAELAEQKRQHDAEVARLQREADDRAAKAAQEQQAREAEAKRIADEAAAEQAAADKRARDREHRGQVMAAAKAAMIDIAGISEERAKKIVLAIVAGEIPHIAISF